MKRDSPGMFHLLKLCKPSAPLAQRCACALERTMMLSRPSFYALRAVALDRGHIKEDTLGAARVYVLTRAGAKYLREQPDR